jgi:DnaK suppressor protein
MTIDTAAAATALDEERAKLLHQLQELGADESGELTGEVDYGDAFADAGAATAERTEVLGLVETLKQMLTDVDAARARIADGSYGTCESCGKDIGEARLEFRPESRLCVDCKSNS